MSELFIDFHCHPSMKPYGKSFNNQPVGQNNANRRRKNSIWFYDSPNLFERAIQLFAGMPKFTESDCTTLSYGNVRLICASLYPIEKGFFRNKLGSGVISELAASFITSVGEPRVDFIQNIQNYFEDLVREYAFYRQLNGTEVNTEAGKCKYVLIDNFQAIEDHVSANPSDEERTIFILMSIEGLHVLNNNINAAPNEASFKANLMAIKQWPHPPFFVTVAHHFYNELCGHAKSLTGIVGNNTDQSHGLNTGFTALGKTIVKETLSNQNGKRIYIDIKHMSAQSRKEYFSILATDYAAERIPVIVSHGAANGLRSMDEPVADGKDTAYKLLAEDINFYDNEILMVAKTNGIFGFQLDERRIASETTLKNTRHSVFMNKIRHYRAELLWNQVQHIAELLDRNDLFAWDCKAIGSDFDGIVNPLNGFLTSETFPHLQEYLERHANNYMSGRGKAILKSYNQVAPSEIVNRLFSTNGLEFLKKWFK
jgi:microsomal dipeptidase-like Zn-dependent dipeptidase